MIARKVKQPEPKQCEVLSTRVTLLNSLGFIHTQNVLFKDDSATGASLTAQCDATELLRIIYLLRLQALICIGSVQFKLTVDTEEFGKSRSAQHT